MAASLAEVDRAAWFPLEAARGKLHRGQVAIIDELARLLAAELPVHDRWPAASSDPPV